ncbi:hypothetical protein [Marinobacter changyiensis]|uniref:hypothetical protein n=1 Tax=Marinobacter changyiensis TaxID=2604091 RepID=UPI0012645A82|nr:hypothetical protein [Marinobacter changyiensis]
MKKGNELSLIALFQKPAAAKIGAASDPIVPPTKPPVNIRMMLLISPLCDALEPADILIAIDISQHPD